MAQAKELMEEKAGLKKSLKIQSKFKKKKRYKDVNKDKEKRNTGLVWIGNKIWSCRFFEKALFYRR